MTVVLRTRSKDEKLKRHLLVSTFHTILHTCITAEAAGNSHLLTGLLEILCLGQQLNHRSGENNVLQLPQRTIWPPCWFATSNAFPMPKCMKHISVRRSNFSLKMWVWLGLSLPFRVPEWKSKAWEQSSIYNWHQKWQTRVAGFWGGLQSKKEM